MEFPVPERGAVDRNVHMAQLAAAVVSATERDLMACRADVDQKTVDLARLEDHERELLNVANRIRMTHGLDLIGDRRRSVEVRK